METAAVDSVPAYAMTEDRASDKEVDSTTKEVDANGDASVPCNGDMDSTSMLPPLPVDLKRLPFSRLVSVGGAPIFRSGSYLIPSDMVIHVDIKDSSDHVHKLEARTRSENNSLIYMVSDANDPDFRFEGSTATKPWSEVMKLMRKDRATCSIQGPKYFGLTDELLQQYVLDLLRSVSEVVELKGSKCVGVRPKTDVLAEMQIDLEQHSSQNKFQITSVSEDELRKARKRLIEERHKETKKPKVASKAEKKSSKKLDSDSSKKSAKRKAQALLRDIHPLTVNIEHNDRGYDTKFYVPESEYLRLPKNFTYVIDGLMGMRRPETESQIWELVQFCQPDLIVQLTQKQGENRGTQRLVTDAKEWVVRHGLVDDLPKFPEVWSVPVVDLCSPTLDVMRNVISTLHKKIVEDKQRVVVHCKAGVGRTGCVLTGVVLQNYMDLEKAIRGLEWVEDVSLVGVQNTRNGSGTLAGVRAQAVIRTKQRPSENDTEKFENDIKTLCNNSLVGDHLIQAVLYNFTDAEFPAYVRSLRGRTLVQVAEGHVKENRENTYMTEDQRHRLNDYLRLFRGISTK